MKRTWIVLIGASLLAACAGSIAPPAPPVYSLVFRGSVRWADGTPAAGSTVRLVPFMAGLPPMTRLDRCVGSELPNVTVTAGADGRFVARQDGRGGPAYQLCVVATATAPGDPARRATVSRDSLLWSAIDPGEQPDTVDFQLVLPPP